MMMNVQQAFSYNLFSSIKLIRKYNKIIDDPSLMTHKSYFWKSLLLILVLNIELALGASIFRSNIRSLQMAPINTLAYSSYTSVQIFNLLNWRVNNQIIEAINTNKNSTYTAAHNQFSYLSLDEIFQQYLTVQANQLPKINVKTQQKTQSVSGIAVKSKTLTFQTANPANPANTTLYSYDWRKNLTGPVKNQGACGACWAFAATADLQTTYMIRYRFAIDFSQQQLIDCSSAYGNQGCGGGMMNNAYQYAINFGVTLQSYYPFVQAAGNCKYDQKNMPHFTISNSNIIYGNCNALAAILKQRPVAVVISANANFVFYKSGILNSCGSTINHALQLVGMVKKESQSYYIGKNSWGTSWGELGYVYIDSQLQDGNLCSVCSYPQYPN